MARSREYQDDLKRIVGVDNTQSGLAPHKEKSEIKGARGIAYFQADGSIGKASGSTPSGDSSGAQPPGDAYGGDQSATPSGIGGSYPGGGGGTTPEEVASEDLDDDTTVAQTPGALWGGGFSIGDRVQGIKGLKDCTTGEKLEVYYSEPPTPEGFDGNVTHWEQGYYYRFTNTVGSNSETFTAASYEVALAQVPETITNTYWNETYNKIDPGNITYVGGDPEGIIQSHQWTYQYISTNRVGTISRVACSGSTTGYCGYTTVEEAEADILWPSDGVTTLVYNPVDKLYKAHPDDPDASLKFKEGVSQLNLCTDDENSDPIYEGPTNTGGSVTYDSGAGIAVFKDENGKITGYGDGAAVTASQIGI